MSLLIRRFVLVSTLAILCLGGTRALGQGTNASLTGQVTDPTGAAVPGAAVTLTNTDTNLIQNSTSNGDGVYIVEALRPGR